MARPDFGPRPDPRDFDRLDLGRLLREARAERAAEERAAHDAGETPPPSPFDPDAAEIGAPAADEAEAAAAAKKKGGKAGSERTPKQKRNRRILLATGAAAVVTLVGTETSIASHDNAPTHPTFQGNISMGPGPSPEDSAAANPNGATSSEAAVDKATQDIRRGIETGNIVETMKGAIKLKNGTIVVDPYAQITNTRGGLNASGNTFYGIGPNHLADPISPSDISGFYPLATKPAIPGTALKQVKTDVHNGHTTDTLGHELYQDPTNGQVSTANTGLPYTPGRELNPAQIDEQYKQLVDSALASVAASNPSGDPTSGS